MCDNDTITESNKSSKQGYVKRKQIRFYNRNQGGTDNWGLTHVINEMSDISSNNSYLHYNGSAYHDRKLVLSTVYDNAPHDWEPTSMDYNME